jgi:hypothetical protein
MHILRLRVDFSSISSLLVASPTWSTGVSERRPDEPQSETTALPLLASIERLTRMALWEVTHRSVDGLQVHERSLPAMRQDRSVPEQSPNVVHPSCPRVFQAARVGRSGERRVFLTDDFLLEAGGGHPLLSDLRATTCTSKKANAPSAAR